MRTVLALTIAAIACAQDRTTVVSPHPDEQILNACSYRIAPLRSKQPVKAVWIIFDRGKDYLNWFHDPAIRQFSEDHRFALILAAHCRSIEREDMIVLPVMGVGRALFTALDQFAESEKHPELESVPVIPMGWSGAGSLAARLAGYRPDRYLAGITYAPGQYEPLGMDTIELSPQAMKAPQLIIANGGDNINGTERPYNYFNRYFRQGAPWTFVVQNRTPHCCLQNTQTLILTWLHAMLTKKPEDSGQYGFIVPLASDVVDEWKRPVFNVASVRISKTTIPSEEELPAGWLPSKPFAAEWLSFVSRAKPPKIWKP